jgi:hypothetical protein
MTDETIIRIVADAIEAAGLDAVISAGYGIHGMPRRERLDRAAALLIDEHGGTYQALKHIRAVEEQQHLQAWPAAPVL